MAELSAAYERRLELTIKMNKLVIKRSDIESEHNQRNLIDEEVKELSQELAACDKVLNNYKQQSVSCRKIGTVFVTFAEVKTAEAILAKYETSFIQSFLQNLFSSISKPSLNFRDCTVVVNRAPAPREVIWENLSFSFLKSFVAEVFFLATMVLVLFGAFKVQFLVIDYAYSLRQESQKTTETIIRM